MPLRGGGRTSCSSSSSTWTTPFPARPATTRCGSASRGAPDAPPREIARGPGRLAQALGLELTDDGASLLRGPLALHGPGTPDPAVRVETGPRVGISKAADLPYRFFERESPWVSPFRPGRAPKRRR